MPEEKIQKIIERVADSIPKMNPVDQGYVLGMSEALAGKNVGKAEKDGKEVS